MSRGGSCPGIARLVEPRLEVLQKALFVRQNLAVSLTGIPSLPRRKFSKSTLRLCSKPF